MNSKNWLNYEHLLFLKNIDIEIVLDTFRVNNVFYHKNCFPKVIVTTPRSSNLLEQKDCLTDGIVLHAIGFIKKNANAINCIFLYDLMHELVITSMSDSGSLQQIKIIAFNGRLYCFLRCPLICFASPKVAKYGTPKPRTRYCANSVRHV